MDDESEDKSFWDDILNRERDAIHIIYTAINKNKSVDLADLEEFGLAAGLWTISEVTSCDEALELNANDPADVIVILNGWVREAELISKALPQMPIALARASGFSDFDFSMFPPSSHCCVLGCAPTGRIHGQHGRSTREGCNRNHL